MPQNIPTRGEIERTLSQSIQSFYRNQLSCKVGKIKCHILGNQIAIAIENPLTTVENFLKDTSDTLFMQSLRDRIDAAVKNQLIAEIKQTVGVEVVDLTIDTTLNHNFTGVFALLSQVPSMRPAKRDH